MFLKVSLLNINKRNIQKNVQPSDSYEFWLKNHREPLASETLAKGAMAPFHFLLPPSLLVGELFTDPLPKT